MWESTADSTFSVREKTDDEDDLGRGTKIVLSLKEDCLEFLEEERLKGAPWPLPPRPIRPLVVRNALQSDAS